MNEYGMVHLGRRVLERVIGGGVFVWGVCGVFVWGWGLFVSAVLKDAPRPLIVHGKSAS